MKGNDPDGRLFISVEMSHANATCHSIIQFAHVVVGDDETPKDLRDSSETNKEEE